MKKLKLTNGGHALIDEEFYSKALAFKWYKTAWGYALRWQGKREFLHHFILGLVPPKGLVVDHINGNKLDNRLENLRVISHKENIRNQKLSKRNTSGHKGIKKSKDGKGWTAGIMVDYRQIHLGTYKSLKDAIKSRKLAEEKYFNLPKK